MATPHEPRLARVAAMVADPARSRMLSHLLSGDFATAGELARAATVSAATASGHLAKLVDARFVVCEPRGRHRYFRLAGPEVAHALEALALVAEQGERDEAWARPQRRALREARCCYGHLAGRLGVQLFECLLAGDGLRAAPEGFALTEGGRAWLAGLGLTPAAPSGRRRYAYACMDWSQRRDHLAGQLADELFRHCTEKGWLRRGSGREVALTPIGQQQLMPRLDPAVMRQSARSAADTASR
jgi:DNA-binding transcriptional ArsR family regulator